MMTLKNSKKLFALLVLGVFLVSACTNNSSSSSAEEASVQEQTDTNDPMADLPDWQYVGYKIAHHMGLQMKHVEEFGYNKFQHPGYC